MYHPNEAQYRHRFQFVFFFSLVHLPIRHVIRSRLFAVDWNNQGAENEALQFFTAVMIKLKHILESAHRVRHFIKAKLKTHPIPIERNWMFRYLQDVKGCAACGKWAQTHSRCEKGSRSTSTRPPNEIITHF